MAQTTTRAAPPQQRQQMPQSDASKGPVAVLAPPRLMMPAAFGEEFGISSEDWRVLVEAIFPSAKTPAAIGMALAYCRRRGLDIFKKMVHIVPVYNSALRKTVESVWPGIAEMRSTAFRTGGYGGMDKPIFGPKVPRQYKGRVRQYNDHGDASYKEVAADMIVPEWCEITVWRFVQGQRVPFPGPRVEFDEIFSRVQHDTPVPNERWQKAPVQMLEKCAEAAALRRAFPEELGDEFSAEEAEGMAHRAVDITGTGSAEVGPTVSEPKREDYVSSPTPSHSPESTPHRAPGDGGQPATTSPVGAGGDSKPTGEPEAASMPAANPTVTDVANLKAEEMEFPDHKTARAFFEFSDQWLQEPGRTKAQADAWEAYYHEKIKGLQQHEYQRIRAQVDDILKLYHAVGKEQPQG